MKPRLAVLSVKLVVAGTAGKLSTIEKMKRRAEGAFGRVDIYVSSAA